MNRQATIHMWKTAIQNVHETKHAQEEDEEEHEFMLDCHECMTVKWNENRRKPARYVFA